MDAAGSEGRECRLCGRGRGSAGRYVQVRSRPWVCVRWECALTAEHARLESIQLRARRGTHQGSVDAKAGRRGCNARAWPREWRNARRGVVEGEVDFRRRCGCGCGCGQAKEVRMDCRRGGLALEDGRWKTGEELHATAGWEEESTSACAKGVRGLGRGLRLGTRAL